MGRTQVSLGSPRAAFFPEASVVKPKVLKRITGLIGSMRGAELPEEIISQELNVHPSFVVAHSKHLEKLGVVGRRSAPGSKSVTLSLTALTRSRLQGLPSRKEA